MKIQVIPVLSPVWNENRRRWERHWWKWVLVRRHSIVVARYNFFSFVWGVVKYLWSR